MHAVTYLKYTFEEIIPALLRQSIHYWLDDIIINEKTIQGHLDAILILLSVFKLANIKIQPAKCKLFATSVHWCGRLLSADSIRYDPHRLACLQSMEPPTTGANLQ